MKRMLSERPPFSAQEFLRRAEEETMMAFTAALRPMLASAVALLGRPGSGH